jgi:hypothetical protein
LAISQRPRPPTFPPRSDRFCVEAQWLLSQHDIRYSQRHIGSRHTARRHAIRTVLRCRVNPRPCHRHLCRNREKPAARPTHAGSSTNVIGPTAT